MYSNSKLIIYVIHYVPCLHHYPVLCTQPINITHHVYIHSTPSIKHHFLVSFKTHPRYLTQSSLNVVTACYHITIVLQVYSRWTACQQVFILGYIAAIKTHHILCSCLTFILCGCFVLFSITASKAEMFALYIMNKIVYSI